MSIKKFILGVCLLLGAWSVAATMTGCHTTEGFGKDVQGAGEGIQDAAD